MIAEQLPLFPQKNLKGEYGPPLSSAKGPLTRNSSLGTAMVGFRDYMVRQGFTENTIKAFLSDLRILASYLGAGRAIGDISTEDLKGFLTYLLYYRGKPCKPKSYARRVTTLKVFFAWLAEEKIIPTDPAAPLVHHRVTTPLPRILYEGQIAKLLETTERLMREGDARPHLLVSLLLHTGIKKGECMNIALDHLDLSDPSSPVLYIRYDNPKMMHKERKLSLPAEIVPVLRQYLAQYQPQERLFECTARNLEYVLDNVAELAGLDGISFEMLRWTCAMRDYRAGMDPEKLRRKLGLSKVSWEQTEKKLKKLAAPAL